MYFATLLKTTAPVKLPISQLSLYKYLLRYKDKHVPILRYKVFHIVSNRLPYYLDS